MAGAGYKLFNTGDVLTAAQVNTYLQEQTVMVFASSTARTTALSGVLAEGMVSYLQDTNAVEVYNGSAWVGVSGAGDVTEVQAGTGISVASGTGPIPVVTNTMATAVDAKGDLIVGTGADTFARLAVGGTNGHSLQVDSSTATGLKWAAAAGAGGLTKIHSSTFSAVSSKSVTDCFSSTYENYKIIFTISAGSNSASIRSRLSTSGSDNTTSNYYNGNPVVRTDYSTANNASGGAASYFDVGRIEANSTQIQGMCFDFMQPELAKRTIYGQSGFGQDATSGAGWAGGGGFDGNTQFQGITFYTTAGTMTGSIAIYGYEK